MGTYYCSRLKKNSDSRRIKSCGIHINKQFTTTEPAFYSIWVRTTENKRIQGETVALIDSNFVFCTLYMHINLNKPTVKYRTCDTDTAFIIPHCGKPCLCRCCQLTVKSLSMAWFVWQHIAASHTISLQHPASWLPPSSVKVQLFTSLVKHDGQSLGKPPSPTRCSATLIDRFPLQVRGHWGFVSVQVTDKIQVQTFLCSAYGCDPTLWNNLSRAKSSFYLFTQPHCGCCLQ